MRRKIVAFFSLLFISLLFTQFLPFIRPQKAVAAAPLGAAEIQNATFKFIDRAHIEASIGSTTYIFFDRDINDPTLGYAIQGSDCPGDLKFDATSSLDSQVKDNNIKNVTANIDFKPGGVGKCTNTSPDNLQVSVAANNGAYKIWYTWVDGGTIQRVDSNTSWTFKQTQDSSQSPQLFIRNNSGSCGNYLVVSSDHKTFQIYRLEDNNKNGRDSLSQIPNPNHDILKPVFPESCELWGTRVEDVEKVDYNKDGKIAAPNYILAAVDKQKDPSSSGVIGNTGNAQHATCESVGGPLSWVLCSIFNGLADFSDWMLNSVVQPLLHTPPVSTDPQDGTFKVWSTFRIYGNLILLIAILVIVFGQTIGGGLIDAYTAKKMVPRILIAAILINLSVYVVAAAVDVTNIIGGGMGGLLIGPFKASSQFVFTPNGIQRAGAVAGVVAGGGITAFLSGLLFTGAIIKAAPFIALFVLLPAVLAIIGAFVTIIIRQGLILFLVLVSPLAFALYCLPNTEQYFRKWWDLFFKTLLVYPIIIAIFAIADIMTVTIMRANGLGDKPLLDSVPSNLLAGLVAFVVQFLPLALIPFAFKFAGGAVSTIYGALSGNAGKFTEFVKGNPNDPNSLRRRVQKNFRSGRISGRGAAVDSLNRRSQALGQKLVVDKAGNPILDAAGNRQYRASRGRLSTGKQLQRRGISAIAGTLYRGGGLESARSELNKEEAERIATQQGFGADDTIRKAWAYERDGRFFDFMSGAEVMPQQVYSARRNLGNISAFQEALAYEQTKANNDGTYGQLKQRYLEVAEERGWSEYDARGMWTGAAFKNKGLRLEQKHDFVVKNPTTGHFEFKGVNYDTFSEEFGQKIRSFQAGDLQSSTFGTMEAAMDDAVAVPSGGAGPPTSLSLADNSKELRRLQNLYHGLTNLEIPIYGGGREGEPPTTATPAGTAATRMSFGGAGIPAAEAQKAVNKIKALAERDPRIKQTPPEVGTFTPQPLTPPR